MSEKQFEKCLLEEATHVEVCGKVYEIGSDKIALNKMKREYYHGECIGLGWVKGDAFIPEEMLSTLGIKPLREAKLKSFDWEGEFDHPNYCRDCGSQWYNCICTGSIKEEEKK